MCYSEPEPAPLCRAAAATAALAEATPACDGGAFPDAAGFEGVEKRLELEFLLPDGAGRDGSAGAPRAARVLSAVSFRVRRVSH